MRRPAPAPALLVLGGAAILLGSLLAWASVRMDLSPVFSLFPPDYRQVVSGRELAGASTAVLGTLVILGGLAAAIAPGIRTPLAWAGVLSAIAALMTGLYHLIRIRVIALDRLAAASGRDVSFLRGATAGAGIGLVLILAGAVLAVMGGVLMLAGRGMEPGRPGVGAPEPAGSGPLAGPAL